MNERVWFYVGDDPHKLRLSEDEAAHIERMPETLVVECESND